MDLLLVALVAVFVGFAVGAVWGQRTEQKKFARVLWELRHANQRSHEFVNQLWLALPWLRKYL